MANYLTAAWSWLRGADLSPASEQKYSPADSSVNWSQQQSLVYTLNRDGWDDMAGDNNSAVFACLIAAALGSIEPPLSTFRKITARKRELIETSPLQSFLDNMNPTLDTFELLFWKEYVRRLDGNAYWLKVRSGNPLTGNVIEVWPVSPVVMRPWTEKGSPNFIDYYRYEREPGKFEEVPVQNVIHFKLGIDPRDPRLGLSPFKKLLREISSDSEATRFAETLLTNHGIPGLVVQLPIEAEVTSEDKKEMKYAIENSFGGPNRGRVGILSAGATMQQFGFNPQQLNLQALHNIPESRICAVLGVPAAVAGLNVGLEQTAQYASMRVIQESFTERTLIPTWRMDEAKLNRWLKPDFSSDPKLIIGYDLSEVRALQEDQDALFARLDLAVQHNWILPDEARSQVGLPPLPDGSGSKTAEQRANEAFDQQQELAASQPAQEPPGQKPKLTRVKDTPTLKAPYDTYAEDLQLLVDEDVPGLERELARHMEAQGERVRRALLNGG